MDKLQDFYDKNIGNDDSCITEKMQNLIVILVASSHPKPMAIDELRNRQNALLPTDEHIFYTFLKKLVQKKELMPILKDSKNHYSLSPELKDILEADWDFAKFK